jgi:cysteine-rich repeat protein
VLLGAVSALTAAGCGDEFTSCYETHTCPRGGTGGSEGGAEGDAQIGGASEGAVAGSDDVGGSATETSGGEAQGGTSAGLGSAASGGQAPGVPEGCGDGIVQAGEECDDENDTSGDGCSETCTVEPVQIVGTDSGICALGGNGQIRCFGAGERDWVKMSVALSTGESALAISAGWLHICALLESGRVRCWGDNRIGQLGLGDTRNRPFTEASADVDLGTNARATELDAAALYSCAVLDDGAVKCWGNSTGGVLGVQGAVGGVGDAPTEMGDNLKAVVQPDSRPFARVAAGDTFACGIRADATVYCWGASGMAGALTPQFNLSLGDPETALEVAVGAGHACAVLTNNALKCWGANEEGQLGQGDNKQRYRSGDMGDALSPVQLGVGYTAKSVALGPSWTCAVLNDGAVKCWGRNVLGELGRGNKVSIGGTVGDMNILQPLDLPGKVRQLAIAGDVTTCALLDNGTITCWGTVNTPSKTYLGDQPNEMGTKLPIVELKF